MKQYVKMFGKKYQVRENSIADTVINDIVPITLGLMGAGLVVLIYFAVWAM